MLAGRSNGRVRAGVLAAGLIAMGASVRAGDPAPAAPIRPWSDEAQVTFLNTSGNTRAQTYGAANLFTYGWTRLALEVAGAALGASSRRVVLAEQYSGVEKVQENLNGRTYVFEKAGWEKNRFAGIADRVDASLGAGRKLIEADAHALIGEAGAGYIDEQRVRAPRVGFVSGRAYLKYAYTLGKASVFTQEAEYLHDFPHPRGYRLKAVTALAAAMSTRLSLKLSFLYGYVNQPVAGFGTTDTLTSAALLVNL